MVYNASTSGRWSWRARQRLMKSLASCDTCKNTSRTSHKTADEQSRINEVELMSVVIGRIWMWGSDLWIRRERQASACGAQHRALLQQSIRALRLRHAATNTVQSPAASSLGSCHRQKASFLNVLVSAVTRNNALPARAAAHQRASGKT